MAEDKGNQGAAEAAKASGAGNLEKSAASRPAPETGVEVRAVAKYVRMAPRKLRLVARAIAGRPVVEARNILAFSLKRAARTMARVLGSAIANAENNKSLDSRDMVVYRAFVDEGPTGKGWTPRARGRASQVHKRTSHVTIVVKEREGVR
jgi:large subunit ribosomal protein L22